MRRIISCIVAMAMATSLSGCLAPGQDVPIISVPVIIAPDQGDSTIPATGVPSPVSAFTAACSAATKASYVYDLVKFLVPARYSAIATPAIAYLLYECNNPPSDVTSILAAMQGAISAVQTALVSYGKVSHHHKLARRGVSPVSAAQLSDAIRATSAAVRELSLVRRAVRRGW